MSEFGTLAEKNVLRPRCPFYGFYMHEGVFIDQEGNQCPLKSGYSPCVFVHDKMQPVWELCPIHAQNSNLIEMLKDSKVFPEEFRPKNGSAWEGIKFSDWADYVLQGLSLPIDV